MSGSAERRMLPTAARLHALCEQVSQELGIDTVLPPAAAAAGGLPMSLLAFYQVTDGLELPFATVHPHHQVTGGTTHRQGLGRGWVAFGHDPYFCDFLCRTDSQPGPPIAVWDREIAPPVEASHHDVVDMLADLYAEHLIGKLADLRLTAAPDGVSTAQLAAEIKPLTSIRSGELLTVLRALPATLTGIDSDAGVRAVRTLHMSGITCHLTNIRFRGDDDTVT